MKRYLAVLLILALLFTVPAAAAAVQAGYSGEQIERSANGWFVRDLTTGQLLDFTGWRRITTTYTHENGSSDTWSNWVFSTGGGRLAEGWQELDGKWYYFWPEMVENSWYDQNTGTVYLFNGDGSWTGLAANASGWVRFDGNWYYVYKYTEIFKDGSYTWAYFYTDGSYLIDGKYYFFKNCKLQTGGWQEKQYTYEGVTYTDWYYARANGELATGWAQIDGKWYYFSAWGGWMYSDRWIYDGGSSYYMNGSGVMTTGWAQIGGDWFYFKNSGAMARNEWILDGSTWYYFGEGGAMYAGGTYTINGESYTFAGDGAWIG